MNSLALIAIGGGSASAMISLSFMAGSAFGLLLGYLAPLPLFLVGLGMGTKLGSVAGISGTILAGVLGGVMTTANGLLTAAGFLVVNALPAGVAIHQSMKTRPAANGTLDWQSGGSALAGMAAFGVVCLAALTVAAWSHGVGLNAGVAGYLEIAVRTVIAGLSDDQVGRVARSLAPFFPGLVAASWVVMLAFNGAIAQAILTRMGRNVRPPERIADLRLPDWLSWVIVGAALLGLVAGGDLRYLARNAVLVLAVPFLFLGLAVIHALIARAPFGKGPITLFYVIFYVLLVFSGWATLAVAGVGIIEQWAGLRRRLAGPHGQENERWK